LKLLVDEGALRRPTEFSIETHLVPQLYNQIAFDIANNREQLENLDNLLS
jgi:hypothetical protein